jgi:hypothetical protein
MIWWSWPGFDLSVSRLTTNPRAGPRGGADVARRPERFYGVAFAHPDRDEANRAHPLCGLSTTRARDGLSADTISVGPPERRSTVDGRSPTNVHHRVPPPVSAPLYLCRAASSIANGAGWRATFRRSQDGTSRWQTRSRVDDPSSAAKVTFFEGTPIPTSTLLVLLIVLLAWRGRDRVGG